jgi:nicotinamidase-related amidase
MAKRKKTKHAKKDVRHDHKQALLIIDMLNTLNFPGGEKLGKRALPAAENIAKLKAKAKLKNIPIIYVNDNFGQWRSDWRSVYQACAKPTSRGYELATLLRPDDDDYFVLKPKHSGFYNTTLDVLLAQLGTKELILTGIAGNICVLFTANDAHMRDFKIIVPRDCIASNTKRDDSFTLQQLDTVFGIDTRPSDSVRLA